MTANDVKLLVDGWIREVGEEPIRNRYAHVYSEGWSAALYAVMGKLDAWRRDEADPPEPHEGPPMIVDESLEKDDLAREVVRLRSALRRIVDHHDIGRGGEMYTSDADLADGLADIARHALRAQSI